MNKLYLFNTLTKKLEEFQPILPEKAGMYYCGPTVYWVQHIGNGRGGICADIIVRTLKYFGYQTTFVRNYTDVGHLTSDEDSGEDKMEKGAKREGLDPKAIADKYIAVFEKDMGALNLLTPDVRPKATEHIQEMIEMVKTLLDKGFAYTTPLAVYFEVAKFADYTKLSGQDLTKNLADAGKGDVSDPDKKNPHDFALWFFKAGVHQNALQTWASPFVSPHVENGQGFPGWHIECSAMSKKYLGETIDIHMGGIEHIPVHHTNEIAQAECSSGKKFVNYWLHNEHLLVDGKKMAKSAGTSYVLQDLIDKGFSPLAFRYLCLQAHYRSKLNFTWDSLASAQTGWERLRVTARSLNSVETGVGDSGFEEKFATALANDFDVPQALVVVQELLKSDVNDADKKASLLKFDQVLGLDLFAEVKAKELSASAISLIEQRKQARINKDFKLSDDLRDQLLKLGVKIKDLPNGEMEVS
jgi:cysteinyl-tRNA synthetase